jgi:beta-lactam-binding protein with PASTA domain
VPGVIGDHFDLAVAKLLRRHFLVSVPRFASFSNAMAEQGWGRLENFKVVSQSVAPGKQVPAGTSVTLGLDTPAFSGPLGSMVEPVHHPTYVRIPDLVGETYRQAMAGGNAFKTGIFVRVSRTGPLTSTASACGLNGFVVESQHPSPGRQVQWGGISPNGVNPKIATVTITLVSRPAPSS